MPNQNRFYSDANIFSFPTPSLFPFGTFFVFFFRDLFFVFFFYIASLHFSLLLTILLISFRKPFFWTSFWPYSAVVFSGTCRKLIVWALAFFIVSSVSTCFFSSIFLKFVNISYLPLSLCIDNRYIKLLIKIKYCHRKVYHSKNILQFCRSMICIFLPCLCIVFLFIHVLKLVYMNGGY